MDQLQKEIEDILNPWYLKTTGADISSVASRIADIVRSNAQTLYRKGYTEGREATLREINRQVTE
jgi:hypothetical protein